MPRSTARGLCARTSRYQIFRSDSSNFYFQCRG